MKFNDQMRLQEKLSVRVKEHKKNVFLLKKRPICSHAGCEESATLMIGGAAACTEHVHSVMQCELKKRRHRLN